MDRKSNIRLYDGQFFFKSLIVVFLSTNRKLLNFNRNLNRKADANFGVFFANPKSNSKDERVEIGLGCHAARN